MTNDLRERLAGARLYLCTDARRAQGDLPRFLDAVLGAGVDIVQLREKGLEAGEELALLEVFAAACRRHGRLLAVNDRADVALAAGADVLHLGQDDLPVPVARRILGPGPLIGRSSHSPAQADAAAAEPGVDYFCAGPLWATPTKPGRPATGPGLAGPRRPGQATAALVRDRRHQPGPAGRGPRRRGHPRGRGPRDHRGRRSRRRNPGVYQASTSGMTCFVIWEGYPHRSRSATAAMPASMARSLTSPKPSTSCGGAVPRAGPEGRHPVQPDRPEQRLRHHRLLVGRTRQVRDSVKSRPPGR